MFFDFFYQKFYVAKITMIDLASCDLKGMQRLLEWMMLQIQTRLTLRGKTHSHWPL